MLIQNNRLMLSVDVETWIDRVAAVDAVTFHPVDADIDIKSALLPGDFHKDPADRIGWNLSLCPVTTRWQNTV